MAWTPLIADGCLHTAGATGSIPVPLTIQNPVLTCFLKTAASSVWQIKKLPATDFDGWPWTRTRIESGLKRPQTETFSRIVRPSSPPAGHSGSHEATASENSEEPH